MTDRMIRARLLVRLVGVLIVGLSLPRAVQGLLDSFAEWGRVWSSGETIVYFQSLPINIDHLTTWVVRHMMPLVTLLFGALLLWRGHRTLERRLLHEFGGA
jgi:hypothetical protein